MTALSVRMRSVLGTSLVHYTISNSLENAFCFQITVTIFSLSRVVGIPQHQCVSVAHLSQNPEQLGREDCGDALQDAHDAST